MTPTRAAAYIGVLSLLAAWLASAAGVISQRPDPPPPAAAGAHPTDAVASEVTEQAGRLQRRLGAAPVIQTPARNPFRFEASRPAAPPRRAVESTAPLPAEPDIPLDVEPELRLIGVAERYTPAGVVRTAMIVGGPAQELLMVTVGEQVTGRYSVAAIGADAVELTDTTTGSVRRLVLR